MVRFIICEDKERDQEKDKLAINKAMMKYDIDYRIHCFDDFTKELEEFINTNTDSKIYILDIELKKTSGLEIASFVRENDWDSYMIFVTTYPNCKNDVFHSRLLAFDYISKHYTYELRLQETIEEIFNNIDKKRVIEIKNRGTSYIIPCSKILYIEKEQQQKRCNIHTDDKCIYHTSMTLTELLTKLGPSFYQSHQSCIINKRKIKKIDFVNNIITLTNGEQTNLLSDRKKKGLREYEYLKDFD